jgi:hypothetical protein
MFCYVCCHCVKFLDILLIISRDPFSLSLSLSRLYMQKINKENRSSELK